MLQAYGSGRENLTEIIVTQNNLQNRRLYGSVAVDTMYTRSYSAVAGKTGAVNVKCTVDSPTASQCKREALQPRPDDPRFSTSSINIHAYRTIL